MEIPRSGVVGHNHVGGNTNILTYDFTSSDQNVVFGYHYAELLNEWFVGIPFDFMVHVINQCSSLKAYIKRLDIYIKCIHILDWH